MSGFRAFLTNTRLQHLEFGIHTKQHLMSFNQARIVGYCWNIHQIMFKAIGKMSVKS